MSSFSTPAAPSSGDKLPLGDLLGSLLLITVHEHTDEITTEYGPARAIRADVACLDGDHKGETWDDTLIFPRVLQSQLRQSVGAKVLGRLAQGEKMPGKNPPWRLDDPTAADQTVGEKYLAHVATQTAADEEPF